MYCLKVYKVYITYDKKREGDVSGIEEIRRSHFSSLYYSFIDTSLQWKNQITSEENN